MEQNGRIAESDRLASDVGQWMYFKDGPHATGESPMQPRGPHYLLFSEATTENGELRWRFILRSVSSGDCFSTADHEPAISKSRLELLAVVRGLEALDQPSQVTLISRSRYVMRGIGRELSQWREKQWHWERFGRLAPIRDGDLWQRVDRALEFHQVECVAWRFEAEPDLASLGAGIPGANPASPEPALLIVPRAAARHTCYRTRNWALGRAFDTIREGILAPVSAILRPAFTRAA
jgi:ribonuclease HI